MIYNMTEVQPSIASEHCRAVLARCRGLTYCMFGINLVSTILRYARVVWVCVCGQPALLDQKDTRRSCAGVHPTSPSSKLEARSAQGRPSTRAHAAGVTPTPTSAPVSSFLSQYHANIDASHSLSPPVHRLLGSLANPKDITEFKGTGVRGMATKGDILAFLVQASVPLGTLAGREVVSEVKQYMWHMHMQRGRLRSLWMETRCGGSSWRTRSSRR
ncbi:hypothetical protein FIBSPDRAFT_385843 [Athelia psychrophila]|uniref:Peripheral subunit-binding (PSBD) domain-containing protein n=1 Tax=Athelia psychrophila TaxID=1759441 RepID=A0A167V702_9AGAM|nr:hypothetical protein FIBSPDRAFT_385843 [Fibularhizoctonia sp. CBS 109695]